VLSDLLVVGSPIGQQDQGGSLGHPLLGLSSPEQGLEALAFCEAQLNLIVRT
jgi:hypothetical protein